MPIFDQGYQHWDGSLSSHAWRWLAITRGVRTAMQGRFVRLLIIIAWLPAIVLTFVLCMWGLVERQSDLVESLKPMLASLLGTPVVAGPSDYRVEIWTLCFHYFLSCELFFSMLMVLLVGPNLISQDLRYNALPLYFSRPLRRIDYFFGKLGIIVAMIGMVTIIPSIVAYAMGLLFSLDITIVRDTYRILIGSIVFGLVIAGSAGLFMLALSSLSRNSRYVSIMWIGFWLLSTTVATILINVGSEQRLHEAGAHRHGWMSEEYLTEELQAEKTDWRPLVSYTLNLRRIEERLLGTNAAWQRLIDLTPAGARGQLLTKMLNTQFPWYWSAGVLTGLAIVSTCILKLSIKSLDRLK